MAAYVTGCDPENKVVYYEKCETLIEADNKMYEFKQLGLEDIEQWAVKPSYRNPHFVMQYPNTHKIICWDKEV